MVLFARCRRVGGQSLYAHLSPATPRTTRLSLVKVPVLSKQHTSTLPAKGIRKGSVQYMSGGGGWDLESGDPSRLLLALYHTPSITQYSQSLARAMREVLTARDSSMGSSGGTTEVRMRVHSRKSL